ncbi:MAG TPA: SagB/ThcOx family dehydrogenase [Candidatus Baltobacteraceae bacterium]|jgi:SagB-type dehydrogenase family enzyme|nr:SagB/ThcOx family dehydrogenase [Candidatus Baltobacteraceae bacterium]
MGERLWAKNPGLLVYTDETASGWRIVLEISSGSPPLILDDPRLLWALSVLPEYFSREDALLLWNTEDDVRSVTEQLWKFCVSELLIIDHSESCSALSHERDWAFYHSATRCYPFLNMSQKSAFKDDNSLMRSYLEIDPYPGVYLNLPSTLRIHLEKIERIFHRSSEDISRMGFHEQLAILFDGTFGERQRLNPSVNEDHVQLELLFKSIPSGGARHPTECFVYFSTGPLPEGWFHYNVRDNSLDCLPRENGREPLFSAIPALNVLCGENPDQQFFAVILLASMMERAAWRYRDSRSFRAVAIDAGHADYQFSVISKLSGYAYAHIQTYDGVALAKAIGLDAISQPILSVGVMHQKKVDGNG